MLLQFSVSNFLSYKSEVLFNMMAGDEEKFSNHLRHVKGHHILRAAALYGANASGKSNLIKAIDFAKNLILNGTKTGQKIFLKPFKLEAGASNLPTTFRFLFVSDDQLFDYGFSLTSKKIVEEWLYVLEDGQERPLFERQVDENGKIAITIYPALAVEGTDLYGRLFYNATIIKEQQSNQLYLTKLLQNSEQELRSVYEWFHKLAIIYPDTKDEVLVIRSTEDRRFFEFLSEVFKNLGTGIDNIKIVKEEFDIDKVFFGVPSELKQKLLESASELTENEYVGFVFDQKRYIVTKEQDELKLVKLMTEHSMLSGKPIGFELEEESDGTQRLFDLVPMLFDLYHNERIYFIDELDRSLHTLLTRELLRYFFVQLPENNHSQLVFTTHDTNLMDLLRHDEIWFINKGSDRSSDMESLHNFDVPDAMEVMRSYLNGRFGGTPYVKKKAIVSPEGGDTTDGDRE